MKLSFRFLTAAIAFMFGFLGATVIGATLGSTAAWIAIPVLGLCAGATLHFLRPSSGPVLSQGRSETDRVSFGGSE